MIQQLKTNIKCDSEPKAGKGSEKWVKNREMSQISKWNGLPEGLRVLEVTYHLKAGARAVNTTNNFMIYVFICNFYVLLATILKRLRI